MRSRFLVYMTRRTQHSTATENTNSSRRDKGVEKKEEDGESREARVCGLCPLSFPCVAKGAPWHTSTRGKYHEHFHECERG